MFSGRSGRPRGRMQRVVARRLEADGSARTRPDEVAVEEPLEIRLAVGDQPARSVAVTMRTPGDDFALAAGFLFSEGILREQQQVRRIRYCLDAGIPAEQQYNVVTVELREGTAVDWAVLQRNVWTHSSCGLCGKAALEQVLAKGIKPIESRMRLTPGLLSGLPAAMRPAQRLFARTGGVHACGLFDRRGELLQAAEDVGRHNALDKLIGKRFLDRTLPAEDSVLLISGRAGFEILQKAAMAGIPIVSAVSAPSSLAVEAADAFGITLAAFVRDGRLNVYTHPERIQPA